MRAAYADGIICGRSRPLLRHGALFPFRRNWNSIHRAGGQRRRNAASPALLEHLPLPDCVIELEAGAETMANRRLQRDQRVKEKGREGREGGPDTDALKREVQARGTRWLVFRNDEDTDLEELVDRIADELVGDSGLVRQ